MANEVTLGEIRTIALTAFDDPKATYITKDIANTYINFALSHLHDILVNAFEDYYATLTNITLESGTESYDLPDDFYKLLKMFALESTQGRRVRLYRFTLEQLDRYQDDVVVARMDNSHLRYRVVGQKLYLTPTPSSGALEMWYAPQVRKLKKDSDPISIGVPIGWEEFVVDLAVCRMKAKEDSDMAQFWAMKNDIRARIESAASNRDAGEPHRISDTHGRFEWPRWR